MPPPVDHSDTNPPAADLAIVGATALVGTPAIGVDGPAVFATDTTIEITGSAISWIGPSAVDRPRARDIIDAVGQVAMPGLINTHCHAAMTFLRGVAEDVPIANWFNDYIWPMEVNVGAHDVYIGTMVAAAEMIESGVTSFADHYFFMDEAARAVEESGMRANLGSAFFSSQGAEGLAQSVEFAEQWNGRADGRITTSIAPHAPYTCNDDDLRSAADEARRIGVRVHTHAAEDMHQTQLSVDGRGITPIQVLADTGVLDAGVIIAHGNGIVAADIELLSHYRDRVGVTHGPKGYLKYALGPLTPIRGLLAAGVPVGYCTDGAASNSTLDIFENMRITAITQKHAADDATWFRSGTALQLAGPGAASVMGQPGTIGELRVGARADVIVVDVSGFHCQPTHDLAATLVYSVQAPDVRTTIVDGKVLMRDRQLTTIDRGALLTEFRERATALTDRSHGRTIQGYTT
jgi:5-methylthioadenosine/S-adenosylhomocysteine deaminase